MVPQRPCRPGAPPPRRSGARAGGRRRWACRRAAGGRARASASPCRCDSPISARHLGRDAAEARPRGRLCRVQRRARCRRAGPRPRRTPRPRSGGRPARASIILSQTFSISKGISGMRITSAEPAMPACSAIQPQCAAHHLDHHHALMRSRRWSGACRWRRWRSHRGVEAERHLGRGEVVVDRLGHPDDRDALLGQARRAIVSEPSPPMAIRPSKPGAGSCRRPVRDVHVPLVRRPRPRGWRAGCRGCWCRGSTRRGA